MQSCESWTSCLLFVFSAERRISAGHHVYKHWHWTAWYIHSERNVLWKYKNIVVYLSPVNTYIRDGRIQRSLTNIWVGPHLTLCQLWASEPRRTAVTLNPLRVVVFGTSCHLHVVPWNQLVSLGIHIYIYIYICRLAFAYGPAACMLIIVVKRNLCQISSSSSTDGHTFKILNIKYGCLSFEVIYRAALCIHPYELSYLS